MKKFDFSKTTIILLTLLLCLSVTFLAVAENSNKQLIGDFQVQNNQAIKINSRDFVPLEEVARILNYKYSWQLVKPEVRGHLNNRSFASESFLIAYGYLYLPLDLFEEIFDIEIEVRGNRYYVYLLNQPDKPNMLDLELVLQTDKTSYRHNQPLAVSLLLLNQSDQSQTLRFNSSKQYDLVLKRYNREFWRLSSRQSYLQVLSFEILKEGDYRLYTSLIEPGSDKYLSAGEYTLQAEFVTASGIIRSNEIKLRIY